MVENYATRTRVYARASEYERLSMPNESELEWVTTNRAEAIASYIFLIVCVLDHALKHDTIFFYPVCFGDRTS